MPTPYKDHAGNALRANKSSDKLLLILEMMAELGKPTRLQDIAKLCGINPSTVHRFLTTLQQNRYVAQDITTNRYYLTFKLCALSDKILASSSVREIALPFMGGLASAFGESCNLALESDDRVLYVEVCNSPGRTLLSTQRIGSVAPLYCTGVGKLMLAGFSPDELDHYFHNHALTPYTKHTITGRPALEEELAAIRARGYAYDNEECEDGARCVAAPLRDYTGKTCAGLSISGPAVRMSDEHIGLHITALLEAACEISSRLGWSSQNAE